VTTEAFASADVDPTTRAEQLDVYQWGRLAAAPPPSIENPLADNPAADSSTGESRKRRVKEGRT
jgi:hypothetical protein